MKDPLITIETPCLDRHITGQSIIQILGGLFSLYKSTREIKVESLYYENKKKEKIILWKLKKLY